MPFDSTVPADNTPVLADKLRENFNALKAITDAQGAQIAALAAQVATLLTTVSQLQATQVPVGGIMPWYKDLAGTPALPPNFVKCNGQVLNDPESIYNGELMPDINTGIQRFLRGGLTSGQIGGIDYFATAQADFSSSGPAQNFVTTDFSPGAVPLPPYVTAVYIIRVK